MSEFIKPISVHYSQGPFGHSVALQKRNNLNQIEHSICLGKIIDVSYSKAAELQSFLEKFLENQSSIILDNRTILIEKLLIAHKNRDALLGYLKKKNAEIEALDKAIKDDYLVK